jgi:hypothetical protein
MGSSIALYHRRLERGMCGGCGYRPRIGNLTRCYTCDERRKKWWREHHPVPRSRDPQAHIRASRKYRLANLMKTGEARKVSIKKARQEVLAHYGNTCRCCGESRYEFLSLDHINNDGAAHRKKFTGRIERWIRANGFPDTFQVLCMNCNFAKGKHGICPHEKERQNVGKTRDDARPEALKASQEHTAVQTLFVS